MTRVGDKTPLFISVLTTHKDSVRIGIGYPDPSTSGKPNASSGSRRYAKAPTPSQSIRPGLGTCTRHGSQLAIIPAGHGGIWRGSKEGERATVTCRVFHALGQSTEEGPAANTDTTECLYRDWLECVVGGDIYIVGEYKRGIGCRKCAVSTQMFRRIHVNTLGQQCMVT